MRTWTILALALIATAPVAAATGVGVGTGLTCSPQRDGIHISWSAFPGTKGYHLYRSTNGGSAVLLATLPATATSYVDGTAAAGNTYGYTLKSLNVQGTETATVGTCTVANVPFFPSAMALGLATVGAVGIVALAVRRRRS